jgi:hypothetical protein
MTILSRSLAIATLLTALGQPATAAQRLAQFLSASAAGVHTCTSDAGSGHTCLVEGNYFSNCIDADSALRVRDCCPSTRVCDTNPTTGETKCRQGGQSTGFRMLYCIGGR